MVKTGQAVKEMLVELSQTDQNIIPPFQADKLQRTIHEIREHHEEMTKIIQEAEDRTRQMQGLATDAPVPNVPWSQFPEDYSAMIVHLTCIQHYKRGLLAYTMERINRLKHLHWHTHQLPAELSSNLAPMEVEFLSQYDKNLKKYTEACQLPTDLSMDAAPPKSRCVQVRVLADHGDMMSKDGKVVLRKDTTHWLPVDEVEALIRAGVVEYLHAGMTM